MSYALVLRLFYTNQRMPYLVDIVDCTHADHILLYANHHIPYVVAIDDCNHRYSSKQNRIQYQLSSQAVICSMIRFTLLFIENQNLCTGTDHSLLC